MFGFQQVGARRLLKSSARCSICQRLKNGLMKEKIQKWNVKSKVVHPISRADWMSLDSDIIQQFNPAGRNPPRCFLTTCVLDMARNTNSVAFAARYEQQSWLDFCGIVQVRSEEFLPWETSVSTVSFWNLPSLRT